MTDTTITLPAGSGPFYSTRMEGIDAIAEKFFVSRLARVTPQLSFMGNAYKGETAAIREVREAVLASLVAANVPLEDEVAVDLDEPDGSSTLALAVAVARNALGERPWGDARNIAFLADLSNTGELHSVRGVYARVVELNAEYGISAVVVSPEDAIEAALVSGVQVFEAARLSLVLDWLRGHAVLRAQPTVTLDLGRAFAEYWERIGDGTERELPPGLPVGNVLLVGSRPGPVIRAIHRQLGPIGEEQFREVVRIYSAAGLLGSSGSLGFVRPFRRPHSSCSALALAGGVRAISYRQGRVQLGEASLATYGLLELDDVEEIRPDAVAVLAAVLRDGHFEGVPARPARVVATARRLTDGARAAADVLGLSVYELPE